MTYCWWKKSCTSWWVVYPIIQRVLYIPGGAGFRPSTVWNHPGIQLGSTSSLFFFKPNPPGGCVLITDLTWATQRTCWLSIYVFSNDPHAPSPSASGLGVGFRYLNTFSQGIWSTRGIVILISWFMKQSPHNWVGNFIPGIFPKQPGDPNCSLLNCIEPSSWWRHFEDPFRLAKKPVIFQTPLFWTVLHDS